jgi:hypothetical protein
MDLFYGQSASTALESGDPVQERDVEANSRPISRTDFTATVYSLTDTGTLRSETTSLLPSENDFMAHEMVAFVTPKKTVVERVKESGFRTIVELGVPALQCLFFFVLKTLVVG